MTLDELRELADRNQQDDLDAGEMVFVVSVSPAIIAQLVAVVEAADYWLKRSEDGRHVVDEYVGTRAKLAELLEKA